jgi:hypothetical protein
MAWWWTWPSRDEPAEEETTTPEETPAEIIPEETPAETIPEETPALPTETETEPPSEVVTGGIVEAVVWDDFMTPDGVLDYDDLVDGVRVDLYHLANKKNVGRAEVGDIEAISAELERNEIEKYEYQDVVGYLWDGDWEPYAPCPSQVTGPGGYWLSEEAQIEYQHGWVGWKDLPLDAFWDHTFYKIELFDDGTYDALGSGVRVAHLNASNSHVREFLPLGFKDMPPFEIQSTTAAICGYVWSDANADLQRTFPEKHLADWTVVLTNSRGSKIASAKTNRYGYYYFQGLRPGTTYKVWVENRRLYNQVAPYYRFFTWPPWGCNKGHHTIYTQAGKYYKGYDFGMLDMRDSIWAPLYYALWWVGLLQYQF